LKNQLRRAVVSVPSNIAEGCGRNSAKELRQFLSISVGSICEVETQLILSHELGFIEKVDKDVLVEEICEIRSKIIRFSKMIRR
ncbi:MAG: four helix bundle protein, partial [Calditrichota bacterium]